MTFINLVKEVKLYTHFKGTEIEEIIKGFINESVLDFLRAGEWEKLNKNQVISMDGSDTYDLTDVAIITEGQFFSEFYLIQENGLERTKIDYRQYLVPTDKSGYWSVFGTDLYVTGEDSNVNFGYKDLGLNYPMTADDHEIPATKYYWDIIKQYAIVRVLKYLGDDTAKGEEGNLASKLIFLKREEARVRKEGQLMNIARP